MKYIEYQGRIYKFDKDAFHRKFKPRGCKENVKERINRMRAEQDIAASFDTIKSWYYKKNSTTDIESLVKIADSLGIDVTEFLIETDSILECLERASSISEEKYMRAILYEMQQIFLLAPAYSKNYSERPGIKGILDRYPRGMPVILLFYLVNGFVIWGLDFETRIRIGSIFGLLCIGMLRFMDFSYFEKNNKRSRRKNVFYGLFTFIFILDIVLEIVSKIL